MKPFKTASIIAISLALLPVLVACTDDPVGIFMSISSETAIGEGTKAFATATPGFLARLGTTDYTNAGPLYARKASGTWTLVEGPTAELGETVNPSAVSGAVTGAKLYVLFASADTKPDSGGVIHSGEFLGILGTADGTAWTEVDGSALPAAEKFRGLFAANGQLFAWSSGAAKCSLFHLVGNTLVSSGPGVLSVACDEIKGIAWDGSAYWFPSGSKLFSGLPGAIAAQALPTSPAGASLTGAAYDAATGLLFSSTNGCIYRWDGAWTSSGVLEYKTDYPYAFSSVLVVDHGSSKTLLAGTKSWYNDSKTILAKGYLEFDADTFDVTALAPNTLYDRVTPSRVNFDTSLATLSVTGFAAIPSAGGQTLYAFAYGGGLWSDAYVDGGAWGGWKRE